MIPPAMHGLKINKPMPDPIQAAMRPILIGASTGGVEALYQVLGAMPADAPPIFVVQHMRPNFIEGFVAGLDRACPPRVVLAQDRMIAERGYVYVAPSGTCHLTLGTGPVCRLVCGDPMQGHRPAVDRLFLSSLSLPNLPTAALLTGMGRDGADGLLKLRQRGATTIAQSEDTCVVYGMPRAAIEMNAAEKILPLPLIAPALLVAAGYPDNADKGSTPC